MKVVRMNKEINKMWAVRHYNPNSIARMVSYDYTYEDAKAFYDKMKPLENDNLVVEEPVLEDPLSNEV